MKNVINVQNTISIKLSQYATADAMIKGMIMRAEAIDFLVSILQEKGTAARVALDKLVYERFGWQVSSATAMLEWFKAYGWVTSEVKNEEIRKVDVEECGRYIKIKMNADGTATVALPYRGNKPFILYEPKIETTEYGWISVKGKREIQVKRKYYTWVA